MCDLFSSYGWPRIEDFFGRFHLRQRIHRIEVLREIVIRKVAEREREAAPQVAIETTAAAIARLDEQCPWLRGAEKRFSNRSRRDV